MTDSTAVGSAVDEVAFGVRLSRRRMLALLLAVGAAPKLLAACDQDTIDDLLDAIRNRPTRRNVNGMSATDDDVVAYGEAVTAMRARPDSDPLSWEAQARIHNDWCTHQNWLFLPWHRIYLFQFEQICRTLSGKDDFALPYWNWTEQPSIPDMFWSGPLHDSTRVIAPGQSVGAATSADSIDGVMNADTFEEFASGAIPLSASQRMRTTYGFLEGTPHNSVHSRIGGSMGSFLSPRDPIFWLHHNMVEYLWVVWNLEQGHPNTNDNQWTDRVFDGQFFSSDGSPLTGSGATVAFSLIYPLLAYQFEPSTVGTSAP